MSAEKRFYQALRQTVTPKQVVDVINELHGSIRANIYTEAFEALYTEGLSIIPYAKIDFNVFLNYGISMLAQFALVKSAVMDNDHEILYYKEIRSIINDFVKNDRYKILDDSIDKEKLVWSLTNAAFSTLWYSKCKSDFIQVKINIDSQNAIRNYLQNGHKITKIAFCGPDSNTPIASFDIENDDLAKKTLNSFLEHVYIPWSNHEGLESMQLSLYSESKTVAYRFCMVLSHYGVLSRTTSSTIHILKNEDGQYLSLQQKTMYAVYKLMEALNVNFKLQKDELGIYDIKENTKPFSDKIKSLLRETSKEDVDIMSYKDISTTPYYSIYFNSRWRKLKEEILSGRISDKINNERENALNLNKTSR